MPNGQENLWHEPRELLRVTLSSIGDAVIITDSHGHITLLNPAAEALTGWTDAEATGAPLDNVFRLIDQESRQPVEDPASRALRVGVAVTGNHMVLVAKDGSERATEWTAGPLRDDKGEVAGVVMVFRDITERRRQEKAVQDAREFSEHILATLRQPFLVVLDNSLRVQKANQSFYRTFQVLPEETENHYVYDLGNGQWNIPGLRQLLEDVLPQNHSFDGFEVEHEFPGIGRKVMLLNARRIHDGEPDDLILLAIDDITERRQSESKLKDSELRYRRLFETARDGILILDAGTGKITDANPFMSEMLGYGHKELVDKELWQIGLFHDRESSRAAFRLLQERGYIRYDHLPLETKLGRPAEVEFVSNLYQVNGQLVIQCNIRDTTERSQFERAKVQAEALADLNRRKDEFLAMLSHELRNPLAPVMNGVQLLRLRKDGDPIQDHAKVIIERQVGVLKALVDDLLEVSRISSGKIRLHQENVDLRVVVERAIDAARSLIDQRRHELTVSQSSDPVWVYADPTRMEQVVGNLLTNAAKYTDKGGRISLSLQLEGEEAVLRVRDTGIGISPDLLPRVFDLFTQAERSLDRSQGGLGIGLTVVQRLVRMHRGSVEAHSASGQGSEFVVRLPVLQALPLPAQPLSTKPAPQTTESLRVLVVDDNVDQADSVALLLRVSGQEVRVAYAGPSALETAAEFQPDVVLMDIGLPGMNGYEIARRLRQDPRFKGVWMVAMTGYGQEADLHRSQAAGFDHHLVKPVDPQKLQDLLTSLTRQPRPGK